MDCLATQLSEKANKAGSVASVIGSHCNCKPHRTKGTRCRNTVSITSLQELHRAREHTKGSTSHVQPRNNLFQIPASLPPLHKEAMHVYPTNVPCPPISSIEFYPPPTPAGAAEHPRLGYPAPYPTGCGQHSSLVQPSWLSAANIIPATGRDTSRFQMTTTTRLQIGYPHFSSLSS